MDDPSVLVDADPSTMAAPAREPSAPPVQYVIDLNVGPSRLPLSPGITNLFSPH